MSEFFLSADFGMLLGVFIFGVSISGRLAAWGRAVAARATAIRKRMLRYRLGEIESRFDKFEKKVNALNDLAQHAIDNYCGPADLEERVKVIEDWLTDRVSTKETEDIIKKKAKERAEAIKKLR